MKIYVGYVIFDYSTPVVQSTNRKQVKEYLKKNFNQETCYIVGYDLTNNNLIVFDSD